VRFRTIHDQGRKLSAYGLFSAHSDRFSALFESPRGDGKQFLVTSRGRWQSLDSIPSPQEVDEFFEQWKENIESVNADSPAIRCMFYAAYEAGALIERLPAPKSQPDGPILSLYYPDGSICFDPAEGTIYLAASSDEELEELYVLLEQCRDDEVLHHVSLSLQGNIGSSAALYKQAVERVKSYISAGDIFQANIARFWHMPFPAGELLSLYGKLRRANPAPFACFARIPSADDVLTLISASPERLFRIGQGIVDTRPIAGTRRRGEGEQDQSLRAELLLSEKERAEHIMLVDLERNDLGRVCSPGTVKVDECMAIEQYATVQHIVSNVCGRLADGIDAVDVFRAMFPGGTITGCPKIRCMQIIHELEPQARGPYTGGLGYIAWDGSADMNILIRTFWHREGELHWAAGAGIVADSEAELELAETGHKAEGLLRAFDRREEMD